MEAAESPLEVLSRAAVMLQRNVLPPPSYDEARSLSQHQQQQKQKAQRKCKPSTNDTSTFSASTTAFDNGGNGSGKWKREKKYQHKTSTTLVCDSTSSDLKSSPRFSTTVNNRCALENEAEPLDMSKRTVTKERGEPPSYFQSILCSNYGRRQTGVPAVMFPSIDKTTSCSSSSSSPTTTTAATATLSDDKEAMCDQVINEHFRRSLGRDYLNVFSTSKVTNKEQENDRLIENQSPLAGVQRKSDADNEKETVNRCISPSPLSVDDHFAKALGATWIKLQQQQKQSENQNKNSGRSIPVSHEVNES